MGLYVDIMNNMIDYYMKTIYDGVWSVFFILYHSDLPSIAMFHLLLNTTWNKLVPVTK